MNMTDTKAIILMLVFSIIVGVVLYLTVHLITPTAMDVYQGNTTLEITYVDGVPIDSVVIFKN